MSEPGKPVPVDFLVWMNLFHDIGGKRKRGHGVPDPRPVRLTAAHGRAAVGIATHINSQSRKGWPGEREIARTAQVSLDSVTKALPVLLEAGWIQIDPRAGRKSHVYRLTVPYVVAVAAGIAGCTGEQYTSDAAQAEPAAADAAGCTGEQYAGVPASGTKPRSEPRSDEKTSVKGSRHAKRAAREQERRHRIGERTDEPLPLHPEWEPNNANRAVAAELGFDVDAMAEAFRDEVEGERRKCWGAWFSEWMSTEGAGFAVAERGGEAYAETLEAQWYAELDGLLAAAGLSRLSMPPRQNEKTKEYRLQGGAAEDAAKILINVYRPAAPAPAVTPEPAAPTQPPAEPAPTVVEAEWEPETDDTAPEGRYWTYNSADEDVPEAVDPEAEDARVAAMFTQYEADEAASRTATAAQRVTADLAWIDRKLIVRPLRRTERGEAEAMLLEGASREKVLEHVRAARAAVKAGLTRQTVAA